jgi:hypothetical protein
MVVAALPQCSEIKFQRARRLLSSAVLLDIYSTTSAWRLIEG